MGRKIRLLTNIYPYHVMNHLVDKLMFDSSELDMCLNILMKTIDRFNIDLISYNFMHNHYHIIWRTNDGNVDKAMQSFNETISKKYNCIHERKGYLWRHRYGDSLLTSDTALITCMRYVDRNAMVAGLVKHPLDWEWSSFRLYMDGTPDFLKIPTCFLALGRDLDERRAVYERLVMTPIPIDSVPKEWKSRRNYSTK